MLNKKLFKKLNEQIEINKIVNEEVTNEDLQNIEEKVIFENVNIERVESLSINDEE